LGVRSSRLVVGPGDDASVVRASGLVVTTIDTVVDGVHFSLSTHSPADVGHKALATALSDVAAMGATPGEAYVALGLPSSFDGASELVDAMEALAASSGCTIAGGDVTGSPVLFVTVSVNGWAESEAGLVLRSGARVGDLVGVTGELGGSAVGLTMAEPNERHRRPMPRLAEGRALVGVASAMIDVSDGIATDAAHIADESGVRLTIELEKLPRAPGATVEQAAAGGDDYELLFTCPPSHADRAPEGVTWIGTVTDGPAGLELLDAAGGGVSLAGFEHL
jgi:thiamine-monophosphate kinase